jgi:hypothetical protein
MTMPAFAAELDRRPDLIFSSSAERTSPQIGHAAVSRSTGWAAA